ncbi:hypothetical protein L1887_34427 [Cichorium endivia]|nr:hypothetical protein L1887_34427 [Cichorium endivia]
MSKKTQIRKRVLSFFDLISLSPHSTPDSLPTPAAAPSRSTSSIAAALFFNLAAGRFLESARIAGHVDLAETNSVKSISVYVVELIPTLVRGFKIDLCCSIPTSVRSYLRCLVKGQGKILLGSMVLSMKEVCKHGRKLIMLSRFLL